MASSFLLPLPNFYILSSGTWLPLDLGIDFCLEVFSKQLNAFSSKKPLMWDGDHLVTPLAAKGYTLAQSCVVTFAKKTVRLDQVVFLCMNPDTVRRMCDDRVTTSHICGSPHCVAPRHLILETIAYANDRQVIVACYFPTRSVPIQIYKFCFRNALYGWIANAYTSPYVSVRISCLQKDRGWCHRDG